MANTANAQISGNRMFCQACGEESFLHLPLSLEVAAKKMKAFSTLHEDCTVKKEEQAVEESVTILKNKQNYERLIGYGAIQVPDFENKPLVMSALYENDEIIITEKEDGKRLILKSKWTGDKSKTLGLIKLLKLEK